MRAMRWGFPRPAAGGGTAGTVGLVADLTNPMWEGMAVDPRYRCVVPIVRFANPEGVSGRKTRTWFSVSDQPTMAWAGFCRNVPGAGPVYAGLTMEANAAIVPTNDRMPLLLERDEIERWLRSSIADVIQLQFRPPFAASRMLIDRTDEPWRGGGATSAAGRANEAMLT